jgi:hypothetical protein
MIRGQPRPAARRLRGESRHVSTGQGSRADNGGKILSSIRGAHLIEITSQSSAAFWPALASAPAATAAMPRLYLPACHALDLRPASGHPRPCGARQSRETPRDGNLSSRVAHFPHHTKKKVECCRCGRTACGPSGRWQHYAARMGEWKENQ